MKGLFRFLRKSCYGFVILLLSSVSHGTDIIAHPSNPVSEITQDQLRAIFSLQMTHWEDGTPVIVLRFSPSHPAHKTFCRKHLRVLPQQLEAVWERLVFTGQSARPLVMESEADMASAIATMPGAIGYIAGSNEQIADIKTLLVNP